MKVVYVLGAGFSKPAGLPLMRELIFDINELADKNIISKEIHESWYPLIRKMKLERIKDIMPIDFDHDLNNIEELIRYLRDVLLDKTVPHFIKCSIAEALDHHTVSYKPEENISSKTLDQLSHWLNEHFDAHLNIRGGGVERIYQNWSYVSTFLLASLGYPDYPNEDVTIISFNYDLLLETYGYYRVFKDPLGEKLTYVVANEVKNPSKQITLIKPNGSINTYYCSICGTQILAHDLTKADLYHCEICQRPMIPYIKVPGREDEAYSKVEWELIKTKLYDADRIIFLGFSMPGTDDWFKDLVREVFIMKDRKWKAVVICHNLNIEESGYRDIAEHKCTRDHIEFNARGKRIDDLVEKIFIINTTRFNINMHDLHYN